jgi:hypothetical protein
MVHALIEAGAIVKPSDILAVCEMDVPDRLIFSGGGEAEYAETIDALLSAGADPFHRTPDGRLPIECICYCYPGDREGKTLFPLVEAVFLKHMNRQSDQSTRNEP